MTNKDIRICLELLHRRILNNSKFAEEVTEAEVLSLIEVINALTYYEEDCVWDILFKRNKEIKS